MILPIGTDVRLRRAPLGNWILIALNVLVFFGEGRIDQAYLEYFLPALHGGVPSLMEYLTYQFRHGDLSHLLGNMLFLWIFGHPVCDRMGSLAYVIYYLAAGVVAGAVYAQGSTSALVGASGAIAAITTAFLVLYPRVSISVFILIIPPITIQLPAMVLIVLKIILWDNIIAPRITHDIFSNVAFTAHLGGYAFGFVTALTMLAVGALPRNQFDLLALLGRWGRRSGLPAPFATATVARPVAAEELASRRLDEPPLSPVQRLREDITDRLYEHDVGEAIRLYDQMAALDPLAALPRDQQLAIANHLARQQRHAAAVLAYEAFLASYPNSAEAPQVHLLVGMVYRRHMRDLPRAIAHLEAAVQTLALEPHRRLAAEELDLALRGAA